MLYNNIDKVRQAVEDNKEIVLSVFTRLLASYAGSSESDARGNAEKLFNRAIHPDSHPVHAVDALEAIFPKLMVR
jgi:hypothetical protein